MILPIRIVRAWLPTGGIFFARTASGATRNTEQSSGAVVSCDQVAHPGVLRILADAGDLWTAMNNTRNSVFRDVGTKLDEFEAEVELCANAELPAGGLGGISG